MKIIIKLWLESTHLHKPWVTHWVYMHWYSHYIIEQKIHKGNGLVPFTFKYSYNTKEKIQIQFYCIYCIGSIWLLWKILLNLLDFLKYLHLFMYLGDSFTTIMLGSAGVVASYQGRGWIAAGSLNSSPSYPIQLHPFPTPFRAHANKTICDALTKSSVQIPAKFSKIMFKNSQDFFYCTLQGDWQIVKLWERSLELLLCWETKAAEEMINICQVPKVTS